MWKGNCADLVIAANATKTAIVALKPWSSDHTPLASASLSTVVPVRVTINTTANSRESPPMAVTNSVRTAGAPARSPDRLMRKNEHKVVSSQNTKSRIRSFARTNPVMANAKSNIQAK